MTVWRLTATPRSSASQRRRSSSVASGDVADVVGQRGAVVVGELRRRPVALGDGLGGAGRAPAPLDLLDEAPADAEAVGDALLDGAGLERG